MGRHDAVSSQLFVVVQGEGWVSGEKNQKLPIKAGEAAYWEKGESHEAGSQSKMIAIVIEGEYLDISVMNTIR